MFLVIPSIQYKLGIAASIGRSGLTIDLGVNVGTSGGISLRPHRDELGNGAIIPEVDGDGGAEGVGGAIMPELDGGGGITPELDGGGAGGITPELVEVIQLPFTQVEPGEQVERC